MADLEWNAALKPMLERAGIVAHVVAVEPLVGGVSSDIVRVDLSDGRSVCAKRALDRLRVVNVWEAPRRRNHYEVAWLRFAAGVTPGSVPEVLAEDEEYGIALLEFLPPADYRLWKAQLLAEDLNVQFVKVVAETLSRIHAASWNNEAVAREFATDEVFDALRLEPYLHTLAERTPDLRDPILQVIATTRSKHLALVHGDVSPKNILVSVATGAPVFLDAECAWYGDPAFDAAFCVNHLVLKAVHLPGSRSGFLDAAEIFATVWADGLPADARQAADVRVAHLLPCLMAARIDGKSPVEYLSEPRREMVRQLARPHIARPAASVSSVVAAIRQDLASRDVQ